MQTVSFAGDTYNIPNVRGDRPWSGLSDFVIAAASKCINTGGGNFTLLADINFGATYGLVSTYYSSRTANIADAGAVRLARADAIKWRNQANDGNVTLGVDTSNNLTYESTKVILSGAIVNADVAALAAIAVNKLAAVTASKVLVSDGSGFLSASSVTTTTLGYLDATSSIQTQLDAKATGTIAAGAANKLAYYTGATALAAATAITATRALVSDANGIPVAATPTTTEVNYLSGVTSAIQTQLGAKASLALDNLASTAVNTDIAMGSHKLTGLSAGSAAGNSVRFEQLKVIQVVVATSTTSFATTSNTFQTTNLSASITPTSASNKIVIIAAGTLENGASIQCNATLSRGGSNILGTAGQQINGASAAPIPCTLYYTDSPASTSSLTYAVQIKNSNNSTSVGFGATNNATQAILLAEVV